MSAGDIAWVLTSSALVLFMTAPGLAMFYSGLVRRKNVLGVMMQCVFLMGLMSVLWAVYGYSLAFGAEGSPWIGNGEFVFLDGVKMVGGLAPGSPNGSCHSSIRPRYRISRPGHPSWCWVSLQDYYPSS